MNVLSAALRSPKRLLFFLLSGAAAVACSGAQDDASAATSDPTPSDPAPDDAGGRPTGDAGPPAHSTDEAGTPITKTSIPLGGCLPFYSVTTTIGGTQSFQLVVDTGSTTTAVASASCASCKLAGTSPLYEPNAQAVDTGMQATVSYGTGLSGWSGEIYRDSLRVGPFDPDVKLDFVAIEKQTNIIGSYQCPKSQSEWQGILGMGPGANAHPGTNAFFDQLVATSSVPDVFAVQLCDDGGLLWLGGYDPAFTTAAPVYTPMQHDTHYFVTMTDLAIGGKSLGLDRSAYGKAGVDTGGPLIYLPQPLFAGLSEAITADPVFAEIFGVDATWFSATDCKAVGKSKAELDATLPKLTISFGDPAVSVDAPATEAYLIPYAANPMVTYWCPGIAEVPSSLGLILLGDAFLRSQITIFDRDHGRMGFAPHVPCP